MKRNIAIILIILSSSGYSQWFPQNSSIQNELSKIFIFGNTGYSTSINTGTAIQKTTNAGDSWLLSGNFGAVVTTLCFLNNLTGFVVSLDGFTHKTTNGGSSWEVYQTAVPYTSFSLYIILMKILDSEEV